MKILLYFFARYLLAPLFVAVMIFVLTGIKTIKSKLSLKNPVQHGIIQILLGFWN